MSDHETESRPDEKSLITEENMKERKEPVIDRIVKDVVSPPVLRLLREEILDDEGNIKIDVLKEHFLREGRISYECAVEIMDQGSKVLEKEDNIINLDYPVTVVGDIHGQFFDLMRLFEIGGDPKSTRYLFLGDYVDRGCFSTEVIFYLWALKAVFPDSLYLLRGNHESRQMTAFFNFRDECLFKYDMAIYDKIMASMDFLPLCSVINKSFFCVHGGLSPDVTSTSEILALDRFQETPREGPFCDLLWSDPFEDGEGTGGESDSEEDGSTSWFGYNETRQCSYIFGVEAVKHFLAENKLTSVIRAHEAQVDGYKMHMINETTGIPRVITIFSAPNYCDVYKNKAACLKFDNAVLNIKQFVDSPHPYYLPNFMDVFQWSLPFVAEKVTDMLFSILEFEEDEGDESSQVTVEPAKIPPAQAGALKKKVRAVTKVLKMYRVLRENREQIVRLKQLMPNGNKLPVGILAGGSEMINQQISSFEKAKQYDLQSGGEKMPGTNPGDARRRASIHKNNMKPRQYSGKTDQNNNSKKQFTILEDTTATTTTTSKTTTS